MKIFKCNKKQMEYTDLIAMYNKLKWKQEVYACVDAIVLGLVVIALLEHLDYGFLLSCKINKYGNDFVRDLYNWAAVNDWEYIKYLCLRIVFTMNGYGSV